MARGNSKLYRIKEEHIKMIPKISNYYIEQAYFQGYMFIKEETEPNKIKMIATTCSEKAFNIQMVNVDVVTKTGVKEYRI